MYQTRMFGLLTLLLGIAACQGTGDDTRSEAPDQAHTAQEAATHASPHWSYEGETGPDHWGHLSNDWSECGQGQSQSPVDIDQTVQAEVGHLGSTYQPASLKIIHHEHMADGINNGHTIQINYTEGDVLTLGVDTFQLVQYHFHSPSEHTVRGRHYAMEMHMVHKSADHRLAVVGVLIEEGLHNSAFDPIWSNLPEGKGSEVHLEAVQVDVNELLPANTASYRYEGSLTTPPCSEGVQWVVMATPIQLSSAQIEAFRRLVHGNNRPVQPLNGRQIATDLVTQTGP